MNEEYKKNIVSNYYKSSIDFLLNKRDKVLLIFFIILIIFLTTKITSYFYFNRQTAELISNKEVKLNQNDLDLVEEYVKIKQKKAEEKEKREYRDLFR